MKPNGKVATTHRLIANSFFFFFVPEFSRELVFKSTYFEIFKSTMTLKVHMCVPLEFFFNEDYCIFSFCVISK